MPPCCLCQGGRGAVGMVFSGGGELWWGAMMEKSQVAASYTAFPCTTMACLQELTLALHAETGGAAFGGASHCTESSDTAGWQPGQGGACNREWNTCGLRHSAGKALRTDRARVR